MCGRYYFDIHFIISPGGSACLIRQRDFSSVFSGVCNQMLKKCNIASVKIFIINPIL